MINHMVWGALFSDTARYFEMANLRWQTCFFGMCLNHETRAIVSQGQPSFQTGCIPIMEIKITYLFPETIIPMPGLVAFGIVSPFETCFFEAAKMTCQPKEYNFVEVHRCRLQFHHWCPLSSPELSHTSKMNENDRISPRKFRRRKQIIDAIFCCTAFMTKVLL